MYNKQVSCDEVGFLIEKDPYDDDVVMSNLWFDGLKLLLVTDGNKGCRYFTKVYSLIKLKISLILNGGKHSKLYELVYVFVVRVSYEVGGKI